MFTMNKTRQEILKEAAAIHRANLHKNLQHRLELARSKGDQNLIRLLEAEANYLS
jgi:quinol monooxygenase YgiN